MKLDREFYMRSGLTVAKELIGKQLVHRTAQGVTKGIIVETEAYMGPIDAAAHSYSAPRTGRTAIQYGPGGFSYIYLIYGMHTCMNIVANGEDLPEAVLIRALEPREGIPLMQARRNRKFLQALCSGPGKLTQAMGITRAQYGVDLCGDTLFVETVEDAPPEIAATRRIGIAYAGEAKDYLWRFVLKGSKYLSAP